MKIPGAVNGTTTKNNSIFTLAESILQQIKDVEAHYEANSLAEPGFSQPAIEPRRTKEYQTLRKDL